MGPEDPDRPFWFSIGGALELGEDHEAAALRELREEVGITASHNDLGSPIANCDITFEWDQWRIVQNDTYFALPTANTTVSLAGLDAIEQATTDEADWWDPDALDAEGTAVTEELIDLMRDAIRTVSQRKA
jgi:8-oxo-dGTP pyrophosphatase MutT (NUDIX family)